MSIRLLTKYLVGFCGHCKTGGLSRQIRLSEHVPYPPGGKSLLFVWKPLYIYFCVVVVTRFCEFICNNLDTYDDIYVLPCAAAVRIVGRTFVAADLKAIFFVS